MLLNVARRLIDVDMKLALVFLLMGGTAVAAERRDRQTLAGAYQRARERFEPVTRQWEYDRKNYGVPARINSTRDEQRQGEIGPWLQPRPLSAW
jgi:hypothetical protein